MTSTTGNNALQYGVYDTSRGSAPSNWQWSSTNIDNQWEMAASLIHSGWPVHRKGLTDQSALMFGAILSPDTIWIYRVYAAGRDKHGRLGRYIFALVRLSSQTQITDPQVTGFMDYFESERSLPLHTKPLASGWPDCEPHSCLVRLQSSLLTQGDSVHLGMSDSGEVLNFHPPRSKTTSGQQIRQLTKQDKLILTAGLALLCTIAFILLNPFGASNLPSEDPDLTDKPTDHPIKPPDTHQPPDDGTPHESAISEPAPADNNPDAESNTPATQPVEPESAPEHPAPPPTGLIK